eukprot:6259683-Lingulodinium_polyedra.AAC.1
MRKHQAPDRPFPRLLVYRPAFGRFGRLLAVRFLRFSAFARWSFNELGIGQELLMNWPGVAYELARIFL